MNSTSGRREFFSPFRSSQVKEFFNPFNWFKSRRPSLLEFCLAALIFSSPFARSGRDLPFYGDEVLSIQTSGALLTFLNGNIHDPIWDYGFRNITAPPMTRYLVGLGCLVTPPDEDLKKMIRHRGILWAARDSDRSDDMIRICRGPFVVLSVLAGLVIFWFMSRLGGCFAGWAWVVLFAFNPFFLENLPMAMNEAPLLLFSAAAALVCASLIDEQQALFVRPRFFGKAALCGFFVGLAAASKINGAMGCGAGMICLLLGVPARLLRGKSAHLVPCLVACALILVVSGIVFIGVNPFLYVDPLARMRAIVDYRMSRLAVQPDIFPYLRSRNWTERKAFLSNMYSPVWATIRFRGADSLNFVLSMIGLLKVQVSMIQWLRGRSENPAATVAVFWGAVLAAPMFRTPIAWPHYFLFPVTVTQASIALSIAFLFALSVEFLGRALALGHGTSTEPQGPTPS